MSDLFTPPADWQRLPDRFASAHQVGALVLNLTVTVLAALALGFFFDWRWAAGLALAGLAWTAWRVSRARRWAHSFAFAEREEDLLISYGLWFKRLTAVPYGRMLSVNVESGPIERAWGLASVHLVTASSESNASVPGLAQADAAAMRDRLIAAGESQALPL